MMNNRKKMGRAWGSFAVAIVALIVGFSGCGRDDMNTGDDGYGRLAPYVDQMNSRLASHYQAIQTALFPQEKQNQTIRRPESAGEAGAVQVPSANPDWEATGKEQEVYASQMLSMLTELGQTVGWMDNCRMMMGGRMGAPSDDRATCSCEPYMDSSGDEIDRHHAEMAEWIGQRDASGLWEEMNRHMGEMAAQLQGMDSHMRMVHGGGMMDRGMN